MDYYSPLLSVRTNVLEAVVVLVLMAVDLADVGFVTRRIYCTCNDSSSNELIQSKCRILNYCNTHSGRLRRQSATDTT